MTMLGCSIVIRAYNEARHLPRLLEGIQRQTVKDVEIILVDSGSVDQTVAIAEQHGAKIVRIPSAEFTFGRSLNFGIQASSRDMIVIASAHVYPVYPHWLEALLTPLRKPQVALVYGKQRGASRSYFSEQRIFQQWFPAVDIDCQASPFCNNANAAVRRSLWDQHPYDESITGLEDVAWAQWAQHAGYCVSYAARAEVIHVHHETPRGVLHRYQREAMAFKRIFPEAHFNAYDFLRLTATNVLSDLLHAGRQRVLTRNAASIFWFRICQFWGTYQGYRRSGAVTQELRQKFYYPHWSDQPVDDSPDQQRIRYNLE